MTAGRLNKCAMPTPIYFADAKGFRGWLEAHAEEATELNVGFYKVGTGIPSITWPESVEEALCFGWIDSVRRRVDERSYQIRFTPRRPDSNWSSTNIAKVRELTAAGRMRPAGLAAFAKRSRSNSGIYSYERLRAPMLAEVEMRSFKHNQKAWAFFEEMPASCRKMLLRWVCSAKRSETRERRLRELTRACEEGRRLFQ